MFGHSVVSPFGESVKKCATKVKGGTWKDIRRTPCCSPLLRMPPPGVSRNLPSWEEPCWPTCERGGTRCPRGPTPRCPWTCRKKIDAIKEIWRTQTILCQRSLHHPRNADVLERSNLRARRPNAPLTITRRSSKRNTALQNVRPKR